jgi:chromosome segregation protein
VLARFRAALRVTSGLVHLASLTLRGFKSFASSTTLRFEPGITCVVGPNGSGKSNVVDALAWVMGEQGPKSLRGGKMEDVIFAGTAAKAPLGRAEVVLTIDNSDGALPIEYAEVTISRIMFRTGGSEYSINGRPCRLLDVQELLSDSGIGREMHVMVGQGQLDAILHANPDERRGFIEEAAGVLKHRRRKEKALRKLEAMGANLTRLEDLTAELRRQLKPLGRQADVARRASVIQADLRDARLRLLADDLVQGRRLLQRELADETVLRERRDVVEADLGRMKQREHALETAAQGEAPRVAAAQETWYRLVSLRERFRGLASLARERSRNLHDDVAAARIGPDPAELAAEAHRVRAEAAELAQRLEVCRVELAEREAARRAAETALEVEETRLGELLRAAGDRRERYARLVGQRDALRSRMESAEAEIGRLEATRVEASQRAERAQHEFTSLETTVAGLDAGELDLDTAHERASTELNSVSSS